MDDKLGKCIHLKKEQMKVCISYSLLFKDERGFSLRFPSCEHPTRAAAL